MSRRIFLLFCLLFCLRWAVLPERAQAQAADPSQPDSAAYRVAEILVQAPRPITTAGGASAIEMEVPSTALPAAPTMEQVLRELPMLHVRTNSRGESELSSRGSGSRQVAVLVDGVPITLAWDARADASVLPATAPREVVYVRGLSSMLHGPNVLGGVIETSVARLADPPRRRSFQLTSGADDLGAFGGTITAEVPFEGARGDWVARGGIGYRSTPGQPLARDVVEPVPDDDLRVNTDAENADGFLALRYRREGGGWLSFSGSTSRGERGIAAELGLPDEDARLWRYPHVSRTLAVLSGGTGDRPSPFGGQGDLEASIGLDRGRTEIDSYTSRTYDEVGSFEHGRDRTMTVRLLGDQTLGARAGLRAAFVLAEIRHDETLGEIEEGATTKTKATYRQRLWSAGSETHARLLEREGGRTLLTGSLGAAYDVGETPESGGREPLGRIDEWGGRAGLSLGLDQGRTVFHAGLSRRGRFPALRELYSGALNRFAPNPDLKPETLTAMEAGVTLRSGRTRLQVVGFRHLLEDAVVRITLEDRRFMRVNRDELKSAGVELLAGREFGPVALSVDLTWQDVKLTDPKADETHRPENLPEAYGSLGARAPLALGVECGARVEFTGSQFAIDPATGEDAELDAVAIAGGYLTRFWRVRGDGGAFSMLETRLSVDNLTDEARYDAVCLPEPGRRFRFELRLS